MSAPTASGTEQPTAATHVGEYGKYEAASERLSIRDRNPVAVAETASAFIKDAAKRSMISQSTDFVEF